MRLVPDHAMFFYPTLLVRHWVSRRLNADAICFGDHSIAFGRGVWADVRVARITCCLPTPPVRTTVRAGVLILLTFGYGALQLGAAAGPPLLNGEWIAMPAMPGIVYQAPS